MTPRRRQVTAGVRAAEARWNAAGRATWVAQRQAALQRAAQVAGWASLEKLLADPEVAHAEVARVLSVTYQYAWRLRRPYQALHRRRGQGGNWRPQPLQPALTPESYAQALRDLRDSGDSQRLNLSLAVAHHHAGWTLEALGDMLGISRQAVLLRIRRALRYAVPPPAP